MQIPKYLGLVKSSEQQLSDSFLQIANRHEKNAEVRDMCKQFAQWSQDHIISVAPLIDRFGKQEDDEPERIRSALFHGARIGGLGALRDLQDLSLLARQAELNWTALEQAAKSIHDFDLETVCARCKTETERQLSWLTTEIKHSAPQALTVEPDKSATIETSIPKTPTPSAMPEFIWAPLMGGLLMVAVGIVAWLAGSPWLLPSLGPTAILQSEIPAHPSARFYNVTVGHVIGLAAGFASVAAFHAGPLPTVLIDHQLALPRVFASALALLLTLLICLILKASHPPAGATTLLVTLGALKTLNDAINLFIGVLLIAIFGEVARRLRLKTAAAHSG